MQKRFNALTIKECENFIDLDIPDEKIRQTNEKRKGEIEATIAGFIPDRNPSNSVKALNIVLAGKTGAGKSATGNLILGEEVFPTGSTATSYTRTVDVQERMVEGTRVRVADTPGSFDTGVSAEEIASEILKVGMEFKEGIHLFVFVKPLGQPRFTKEEKEAFYFFQDVFSRSALNHCIFFFTHGQNILSMSDVHDKRIKGYLKHSLKDSSTKDPVREIYKSVGDRVVAVENCPPTPYAIEVQRKRLLAYFQSTVNEAIEETFKYEAFEVAKAEYEKRVQEESKSNTVYSCLPSETAAVDDKQTTGLDMEEVVSCYFRDKSSEEMKMILKDKMVYASFDILNEHPHLKSDEKELKKRLKSKAEILTDSTFLYQVKDAALAILGFAGGLINPFSWLRK